MQAHRVTYTANPWPKWEKCAHPQTRGNKIGWVWNCYTSALAAHTTGPRPAMHTHTNKKKQPTTFLLPSISLIDLCVYVCVCASSSNGGVCVAWAKKTLLLPKATSEYEKKTALGLWLLGVAPQFISLAGHSASLCAESDAYWTQTVFAQEKDCAVIPSNRVLKYLSLEWHK